MRFSLLLLMLALFVPNPVHAADDEGCLRMPCLGKCISKEEAKGRAFPMVCLPISACYKAVDCVRRADGSCGWKETPGLSECVASKTPKPVLIQPQAQ